jgi:hypothetical protein
MQHSKSRKYNLILRWNRAEKNISEKNISNLADRTELKEEHWMTYEFISEKGIHASRKQNVIGRSTKQTRK